MWFDRLFVCGSVGRLSQQTAERGALGSYDRTSTLGREVLHFESQINNCVRSRNTHSTSTSSRARMLCRLLLLLAVFLCAMLLMTSSDGTQS